jgi:predicted transglutaminase-like cysteine proteinase
MFNTTKIRGEKQSATTRHPRISAIQMNMGIVPMTGTDDSCHPPIVRRVDRSNSMYIVRFVTTVAILFCMNGSVFATPLKSGTNNRYMRVHGQALPPFGFVSFCQRNPEECAQTETRTFRRTKATPDRLRQLDIVNRDINARIQPVTDKKLYGREEYWTMPTQQGDCEDYVVLKRRVLMQDGWPASALLITVVLDEQGAGHAVLTVRTQQGDFVLDNKVDDVRVWNQTPYTYLMRQSYLNPQLWMALDPKIRAGASTVAGVDTQN